MSDARLFRWLMQHASSEGSRSTALKPLGWLIGMLLASMVAAGRLADSLAIVVVLCVFCGMTLAVYLGAYIYLVKVDRDALRSERYSLQKLAIEKGSFGDSVVGIVEALNTDGDKNALPAGEITKDQQP